MDEITDGIEQYGKQIDLMFSRERDARGIGCFEDTVPQGMWPQIAELERIWRLA